MLCSDEMGILPVTNEWPESLMVADRSHMVIPSSSNSSTTSTPDTAARHPTGPLKCPRCDSPNTKFCYYNNYSLSQPRHFCKACKRYWTRGGTLRNVPIGGGCRKNKRVKKTPTSTNSPTLTLPPPPISSHVNFSNTADINPNFFCNLSNTISYPDLQQRMQEYYDLQPQMKASLGFGFTPTTDDQYPHHFRANITDSTAVSSAMKDYYYPLFGSSSATAASLLVSSLKQPRKIEEYQSLMNYNDQQLNGNLGVLLNQVKLEGEANNSLDWQLSCEAPFDAMSAVAPSAATSAPIDSSFLYWNGASSGNWQEANYGSSITPLI